VGHVPPKAQLDRPFELSGQNRGLGHWDQRKYIAGRLDLIKKRRNALGCNAAACNPIKEKRSFVPGKPIEDACGHGTRVLNLLLRTAPDADYFVAKISDGMDDQDEGALDSVLHVSYEPLYETRESDIPRPYSGRERCKWTS
jgi:hypothetical protein